MDQVISIEDHPDGSKDNIFIVKKNGKVFSFTYEDAKYFRNYIEESLFSCEIDLIKNAEGEPRVNPIDNLNDTCMTLQQWLLEGKYGVDQLSKIDKSKSFLNRYELSTKFVRRFEEFSTLSQLRGDVFVSECFRPIGEKELLEAVIFFYFKLDNNGDTYIFKHME